ncbi:MAG TPA: hypothetical protein ENI32_00175 [Candidatus Syntrophoarchaeum butanivorans]|uniref:MarR family transcriptional regulator n=1 Tax=Candidatus Syntropharchaeum butanivorans TaxID=1839936 RepID=A0A1F2P4X2_9EURY|nr:MAG: MarR family transcriptional regulator [Candidatus Syntrophoarchaeum butanivorans]HEC56298.1 hypothetical protein [Candidatus Syntrophoarchaeum butanivorans]
MNELEKMLRVFELFTTALGGSTKDGKILGALWMKGGPMSVYEISDATNLSLTACRNALERLERHYIIKRVKERGDRKVYYTCEKDLTKTIKKVFERLYEDLGVASGIMKGFEGGEELKLEIDRARRYLERILRGDLNA